MSEVRESENRALTQVLQTCMQPYILKLDNGAQVIATSSPDGVKLHSAKPFGDECLDRPERREGTAHLTTLKSLVDHVNRFKRDESAIFAVDDRTRPLLIAVIDYHHGGAKGLASFRRHRAEYAFPLSDEWNAWNAVDGVPLAVDRLAEHLEEHIADVIDPGDAGESIKKFANDLGVKLASPATLMTLAKGLSMKVPGGLALAIPVFRGGALYSLAARLRYKVQGGNITWRIVLHRTDRVFEHAFREAAEVAKAQTELPLFYGTPER